MKPGQSYFDLPGLAPLDAVLVAHHYLHSVPSGKSWYFDVDCAVVCYSIPANKNIARFLLGEELTVLELSRLWAPDGHEPNLLTRAISQSLKQLRFAVPELSAVVSYADPNVGHTGGVYRAASWIYTGQTTEPRYYKTASGQTVARRKFHSGNRQLTASEIELAGYTMTSLPGKHRYAHGLTSIARKLLRQRFEGVAHA